jgi:hypothetical protein
MAVKTTLGGGAMLIEINSNIDDGIKKFKRVSKDQDYKGKVQVGLALLNGVLNGTPKESTVPPIDTGHLRGSGSVFVGNNLVGEAPKFRGQGQPNRSHRADKDVVTVGFNANYAIYTHERDFVPGEVSQQSGNVGNKWMEKHLIKDRKDLIALYAKLMKERLDKSGV